MHKSMILACVGTVLLGVVGESAQAQWVPKSAPRPRALTVRLVESDDDGQEMNDIEGAIWEYKIAPPGNSSSRNRATSKVVRGKLRIKGTGIFSVGDGPIEAESEHRVGDVAYVKENNTLQLRFDDHEVLNGRAVLQMERKTREEGGVFTGYYLDANKKRSKFELRRGED